MNEPRHFLFAGALSKVEEDSRKLLPLPPDMPACECGNPGLYFSAGRWQCVDCWLCDRECA